MVFEFKTKFNISINLLFQSQTRSEKQALRQINQELMDRLKKLWNCYKQKSPERFVNSTSSSSSTASANNVNYLNDVKVVW